MFKMRPVMAWAAGGLLLAVAVHAAGQGQPPIPPEPGLPVVVVPDVVKVPVPATTTPVEMDAYQKELLRRLESGNAAEKEAAQKELAAIASFWNQPDMLKRMAEAVGDGEIRTAFQSRARDLEFEALARKAGEFPAISLTLKEANADQLALALNNALAIPTAFTRGRQISGAFTLEVKDKPFWEVIKLLQAQQPFDMQSVNNGIGIAQSPNGIHRMAINGAAILFPRTIAYSRLNNPQTGDAVNKSLQIQMAMVTDPRMEVSRCSNLGISRAVDEQGRNYLRAPIMPGTMSSSPQRVRAFSVALDAPEPMGKRLSLTCEVMISVVVAQQMVTINNVADSLDKAVAVGDRQVRISRFDVQGSYISIMIAASAPAAGDGGQPLNYTLVDAAGKVMWTGSSSGTLSASPPSLGFASPYRLEVRGSGRLKDIPLKFELSDIPLP